MNQQLSAGFLMNKRVATDIVGSNVRHLLYLPIVVLLAKMLPQEARREFISWISDFKFQGRARPQR